MERRSQSIGKYDIIIENDYFKLVIDEKCRAKSLFCKETGEECLKTDVRVPLFSITEERPFNNEIKLAYMNKRTVFEANRVRIEDGRLIVGFELLLFEAVIGFTVKKDYASFELIGFNAEEKDFPQPMDYPPVSEFRLIALPYERNASFGQWLNVCHTDKTSSGVMAVCPAGFTDSTCFADTREEPIPYARTKI